MGDQHTDSRYWAFISYSHRDKAWGRWLHRALETYRVPTRLVGRETTHGQRVPPRMTPIFRDREELPTATNLSRAIDEALEQSRYLIVICSPDAAKSQWVNKEILTFKRLGREDRILAFIVAGEPNATDKPDCNPSAECFPLALRFALDPATCQLSEQRTEPIAADARPHGDGRAAARLKLAAGVLGVGFDDLRQREAQRRQRRLLAVTASSLTLMVLMAALLVWALFAQTEAVKQQEEAVRQAKEVRRKFAVQLAVQSDFFATTHPQRSLLLAVESVKATHPQPAEHAALQRLRDALSRIGGVGIAQFDGKTRQVTFTPDSQWLIIAGEKALSLWKTQELARDPATVPILIDAPDGSPAIHLSPDGRWLATISGDGPSMLRLYRFESLTTSSRAEPALVMQQKERMGTAAFSRDGNWLAAAGNENSVLIWNLAALKPGDNSPSLTLQGHAGRVGNLAFHPDSRWLATADLSQAIRLWDVPAIHTSGVMQSLAVAVPPLFSSDLDFSPDGQWLAAVYTMPPGPQLGGRQGILRLWNFDSLLKDPDLQPISVDRNEFLLSLRFSPDSQWLAVGGGAMSDLMGLRPADALVWNVNQLAADANVQPVFIHEGAHALAFSPDSKSLLTGAESPGPGEGTGGTGSGAGGGGDMHLWSMSSLQFSPQSARPVILAGHDGLPLAGAFSVDGLWLVTTAEDRTARLWRADRPRANESADPVILAADILDTPAIYNLHCSADSRWLMTGRSYGPLNLWQMPVTDEIAMPRLTRTFADGSIAAFSARSGWLAVAQPGQPIALWKSDALENGEPLHLTGYAGHATSLAFNSNGQKLAIGDSDGTLAIIDVPPAAASAQATGVPSVRFKAHQSGIYTISFDVRGRLTTGGRDDTIRHWTLDPEPRQLSEWRREGDQYISVETSPDGRWLLHSKGKNAQVTDLDAVVPDPVALPEGFSLRSHAFSSDHQWIAAGDKGQLNLWPVAALAGGLKDESIRLTGVGYEVERVRFSPDGKWLVVIAAETLYERGAMRQMKRHSTVRFWRWPQVRENPNEPSITIENGQVWSARFSPDGRWFIGGCSDGRARLWRVEFEDLLRVARHAAGRNFTRGEANRYLGGDYAATFDDLPTRP